MSHRILRAFLERQRDEGLALAGQTDLVELYPGPENPPRRYIVRFHCRGLIRNDDGAIVEANLFEAGIRFPGDYLRRVEPMEVVTWLGPRSVFHPNISSEAPVVCLGRLTPGMPLVDIVYQLYEIITYQKVTMREDDSLNPLACIWARRNQHRFPIDPRPLKRRQRRFQVQASDQPVPGGP